MQVEGDHYWETYSPVIKWMTLRSWWGPSLLSLHLRQCGFHPDLHTSSIWWQYLFYTTCRFQNWHGGQTLLSPEVEEKSVCIEVGGFILLWDFVHSSTCQRHSSGISHCIFCCGQLFLVCYIDDCLILSQSYPRMPSISTGWLCSNWQGRHDILPGCAKWTVEYRQQQEADQIEPALSYLTNLDTVSHTD